MPKTLKVEINVSQLSEIAHTGVQRAVMFLGLGLNAAHRKDFLDYQLRKLPKVPGQTGVPIDFFPPDLPETQVQIFKDKFSIWIMSCGLREILEHYALFLDRIHMYCLQALASKNHSFSFDPNKAHKEFVMSNGVPGKLRLLRNRFSVKPDNSESVKELYIARNCLTHDLGVVKPSRCGEDGFLRITWNAFDIFLVENGSEEMTPILDAIGTTIYEGGNIVSKPCVREKKFSSGDNITFTQQDLWEICYSFNAFAIPSMTTSFLTFLKSEGIPTTDENKLS